MHHFDSDGVSIAFIDVPPDASVREDDEPILLIHGFASNHAVNWVNTGWVEVLVRDNRRVIALDNRGHGRSGKLYDPARYANETMAEDARRLLDHLGIARADVMGYSMGARITAHFALAHPERTRSALLGGLGIHLVEGAGLPPGIADAMEAPSLDHQDDQTQRMFRAFAEQTGSDLRALAACIRGTRQNIGRAAVERIIVPTLVSVGTRDQIAGSASALAAIMPNAQALDIPGRDHNLAVGDRAHKEGVLAFLAGRP